MGEAAQSEDVPLMDAQTLYAALYMAGWEKQGGFLTLFVHPNNVDVSVNACEVTFRWRDASKSFEVYTFEQFYDALAHLINDPYYIPEVPYVRPKFVQPDS